MNFILFYFIRRFALHSLSNGKVTMVTMGHGGKWWPSGIVNLVFFLHLFSFLLFILYFNDAIVCCDSRYFKIRKKKNKNKADLCTCAASFTQFREKCTIHYSQSRVMGHLHLYNLLFIFISVN